MDWIDELLAGELAGWAAWVRLDLANKLRAAHEAGCEHKETEEHLRALCKRAIEEGEDDVAANDARWRKAVENVRRYYPEDVFPPDGESQECKAAATIRAACNSVLKEAEYLKEEDDDGK